MPSIARSSSSRPESAAACREPFDQSFHVVGHRADLSSDARLLHAYLVSLHRTGRELTQAGMADEIGLTRHRVWSGLRELVAAGLLATVRVGLGRPNRYVLLALPETALRPVRKQHPGQSGNPARAYLSSQETSRKNRRYAPGDLMVSRYGPVIRR